MTTVRCIRCQRPQPDPSSPEYVEWQAVTGPGGEPAFACWGCLTEDEQRPVRDLPAFERDQQKRGDV